MRSMHRAASTSALLLLLVCLALPVLASMRSSERVTAAAMHRWRQQPRAHRHGSDARASETSHWQPLRPPVHKSHVSADNATEVLTATRRLTPHRSRSHRPLAHSAVSAGCVCQWSVSRPEGTRRFWVRLPAEYNSSTESQYPLLFALHGLGDTCEDFGPATGFGLLADNTTRPFIFVYPCGWPGLIGPTQLAANAH